MERPSYLPASLTKKEEELAILLINGFVDAVNRTIVNEALKKKLNSLPYNTLMGWELEAIRGGLAGYGSVDVITDLVESCEPIRRRIFPIPVSTLKRAIKDQSEQPLSEAALDIGVQVLSSVIPDLKVITEGICGEEVRKMVREIGVERAMDIAEIITTENLSMFDACDSLIETFVH
jgi:hypothetical protein